MSFHFKLRVVGGGARCFITAEAGINHNGDLDAAKRLVDAAQEAGADAVKFQRGEPKEWIPARQWSAPRQWLDGTLLSYLAYRERLEFKDLEWKVLTRHCERRGIFWYASALDLFSVQLLEDLGMPLHKVASCQLTNDRLLERMARSELPVILSTGMSTLDEVKHAVGLLPANKTAILHAVSVYPCPNVLANLRVMDLYRREFPRCPVGYSGHEIGLQITLAAVARGAELVERHITLCRAGWGSDQAASVEPEGFKKLVRDIRIIEAALGDGAKVLVSEEAPARARLRRV